MKVINKIFLDDAMKGDGTALGYRLIFYGCAAFGGEATLDGREKWVYCAILRGHIIFDIDAVTDNIVWSYLG